MELYSPPAGAVAAVLGNGTAALPSLAFISDPDTGIYRYGAGILGVAADGKHVASFDYRLINSADDNATLTLGVPNQAVTNTSNDTYPTTINFQNVTVTGNANVIANSFGDLTVTATDTVTKSNPQGILEMDKLTLQQTGGAVLFTRLFNTRFRTAIPKTGVTVTDAVGITFVLPAPGDVTGTVTNAVAIDIPSWASGGATNYIGMRFNNNPANGSIVSVDGVDLSLKAGVATGNLTLDAGSTTGAITATGPNITVNASASSGRVNLQQNSRTGFQVATVGASLNFVQVSANNTPMILAGHASTADLDMFVSSKGTGSVGIYTGAGAREQVRITDTASAANRINMTGAASGANPKISTSAENLILGTGAAIATTATAGYVLIPTCAGPPTGVPTAAGAGAAALHYDSTNLKLYVYVAAWKSVQLA